MYAPTVATLTATVSVKTSPVTRIVRVLDRFVCGLRGHHLTRAFERQRAFLRCTHCGHETPGWRCE